MSTWDDHGTLSLLHVPPPLSPPPPPQLCSSLLQSLDEFRTDLRFPGLLGWWSPRPQALGRPRRLLLEEIMGNNMNKDKFSVNRKTNLFSTLWLKRIMRILRKELQLPVAAQCQRDLSRLFLHLRFPTRAVSGDLYWSNWLVCHGNLSLAEEEVDHNDVTQRAKQRVSRVQTCSYCCLLLLLSFLMMCNELWVNYDCVSNQLASSKLSAALMSANQVFSLRDNTNVFTTKKLPSNLHHELQLIIICLRIISCCRFQQMTDIFNKITSVFSMMQPY